MDVDVEPQTGDPALTVFMRHRVRSLDGGDERVEDGELVRDFVVEADVLRERDEDERRDFFGAGLSLSRVVPGAMTVRYDDDGELVVTGQIGAHDVVLE